MKRFIVFISLLILVFSFNVSAQDKVAQKGVKMLDVGAGARACGMGEAFTVLGQDATALFYNPSGIAEINGRFDLSAGMTQWIADIRYTSVALAYNAGAWGSFGFSLIVPDYGDFIFTKVDPTNTDGFSIIDEPLEVSALCAGVAYAREFTDKFTVGLQAKYVSQHLGETEFMEIRAVEDSVGVLDTLYVVSQNEISTMSFDFGLLFYPGFKSFAFGMSVRNFSPRVSYERFGFEMPLTFALGVGVDILDFFGEYPDYSLNIGAEMLHPRDWQEQFHLGAEFGYKGMIFFRAGYKFRYSQEGLNAGVGLSLAGVKIDYSYSEFELFDYINRVSVGMAF
jgi:hypothetical protein